MRVVATFLALSPILSAPALALRDPEAREKKPEVLGGLEEVLRGDPTTSATAPSAAVSLSSAAGLEEGYRVVPVTEEYALRHAEELAAIDAGDPVWKKEGRWGPERFATDVRPTTGTRLQGLWKFSFVAEDVSGIPVAYIYAADGQPDIPVTARYRGAFIARVSVRPNQQGRRLGPRLLLAVARAAKEADVGPYVTLETDKENTRARHVYESLGFRSVGERLEEKKGVTFIEYAVLVENLIQRAEEKLAAGLEEWVPRWLKGLATPEELEHWIHHGHEALAGSPSVAVLFDPGLVPGRDDGDRELLLLELEGQMRSVFALPEEVRFRIGLRGAKADWEREFRIIEVVRHPEGRPEAPPLPMGALPLVVAEALASPHPRFYTDPLIYADLTELTLPQALTDLTDLFA
ncbi:MAG: GNAT family N-acetyltransferase [Candidatus Omnitrophica bacterium]|nr:GNAT family N-acetyltransferase [Candidatus Omnitrophota bacterium]